MARLADSNSEDGAITKEYTMIDGETRTARHLVTGAAGFVGQHLVRSLLADGHTVAGLDHRERPDSLPADLPWWQVDVRDDAALQRALATIRPDVVHHLAAQVSVVASMRDPHLDIETNVLGTVQTAEAARDAGCQRFVFISTGGALIGADAPAIANEQTPPHPTSVYGASKLAAEQLLPRVLGGMAHSIVRPGNIYGPGQDPNGEAGVVAIFGERMLRGEPVTLYGDGAHVRDYVYIEDVVRAIRLAAEREPATCIVGSGEATTTRTVFETLARLTGYGREPIAAPSRPGEVQRIRLDSARAAERWGWEARVSLDDGLRRTVEAFRRTASA